MKPGQIVAVRATPQSTQEIPAKLVSIGETRCTIEWPAGRMDNVEIARVRVASTEQLREYYSLRWRRVWG